jgi:glutamyl-tRNA synthetase
MVNYLARLGWSHGDEEVFSREQLVEWFDFRHVSRSPARWDPEKLKWMNGEYLRRLPDLALAEALAKAKPGVFRFLESVMDPVAMTGAGRAKYQLLLDHENFLMAMATPAHPGQALAEEHLGEPGREVLKELVPKLKALPEWSAPAISATLKETTKARGVKPPLVMMPFRVALTGQAQTPAIDAIAAALRREVALERLEKAAAG